MPILLVSVMRMTDTDVPPLVPHLAARLHDIRPFRVMALLARARALEAAGCDIVHMEIGEPDFPTPAPVVAAAQAAIAEGAVHYTPALGLPALREAIAGFYQSHYGVSVPARRVVVTPGASGALLLTLGALLNPGEAVLMADPGYPCNRHFARFVEGHACSVAVTEQTGFQLTPTLVERHWGKETVAVLVASPANPTGTVVPESDLREMAAIARSRGGVLIVDEIYHGLIYDGEDRTVLSLSDSTRDARALGDNVFVINSFSKYFGMTGWRLGWLVSPDAWVEAIDRLAQNLFLAASTPAQYAALAAFAPDSLALLDARRQAFQARRDFLLPALRALGFGIPMTPQGAFYLYADCSAFTDDSAGFATRLLEEAGVAVTPGLDFGVNAPERHLRFAYTTALPRLQEGVRRLRAFLG